jgi:energy-coupling factor transporter ATP-binding protein EcfA2
LSLHAQNIDACWQIAATIAKPLWQYIVGAQACYASTAVQALSGAMNAEQIVECSWGDQ